jgi:hypothetical protein
MYFFFGDVCICAIAVLYHAIKRISMFLLVTPHRSLKTLRILLGESLAERSEGARGLSPSSILNVLAIRKKQKSVRAYFYTISH